MTLEKRIGFCSKCRDAHQDCHIIRVLFEILTFILMFVHVNFVYFERSQSKMDLGHFKEVNCKNKVLFLLSFASVLLHFLESIKNLETGLNDHCLFNEMNVAEV